MSTIGKKLNFGSAVEIRVTLSLQEINASLHNVPKSDRGQHVFAN